MQAIFFDHHTIKQEMNAEPAPVVHTCLAPQEAEIRRITVRSQPRQIVHETLSQKYQTQNSAHVVECLLNKREVLSSKPSIERKKEMNANLHCLWPRP
jgi:hypothetical protein